ncbi:RecBCD enzyme subunit RecB [Gammaproteobacteria bacterium]
MNSSVFDPLDPLPLKIPLRGSCLIEASAGTGKTWVIAALYVRLILGHGGDRAFSKPLTPKEILVVTFTNLATEELRNRIRERLREAAHCFRGQPAPDEFLTKLKASFSPEQYQSLADRLEISAENMDESAIYTIHSWCSRMLQKYAFESGLPFEIDTFGENEDLFEEATRDYWRTFYYSSSQEVILGIYNMLDSKEISPSLLAQKIKELLQYKVSQDFFKDFEEVKKELQTWGEWKNNLLKLEMNARKIWKENCPEIEEKLREVYPFLNGQCYPKRFFDNRLRAFREWAENGVNIKTEWVERFSTSGFIMRKGCEHAKPKHSAFDALDGLSSFLNTVEPEIGMEPLYHAMNWVKDRYSRAKDLQSKADFDDLLVHLSNALRNSDFLAKSILEQFPAVLIDEFQDTDKLQYDIFQSIYGNIGEKNLFLMIGDPKQAIYSFRGADIYTYLRARKNAQEQKYFLDTNYRSSEPLVTAINKLFQHAQDPFLFSAILFSSIRAHGLQDRFLIEGDIPSPMNFFYFPGEEGQVVPLGTYREIMARFAARKIAKLLFFGNQEKAGFQSKQSGKFVALRPSDITILVRDHKEATAIRTALSVEKVRSLYFSEKDSVFQTEEAQDMLCWLKACVDPKRFIRTALGTATLGLSYAELDQINREENILEEKLQQFYVYHTIWRKKGILPMLDKIFSTFEIPKILLRKTNGERILTNLLHLGEILQTESVFYNTPFSLIQYFENAIEHVKKHLVRLESDENLIQVVTIHKAKGMEYPLVFLPFICSLRPVEKIVMDFYGFSDSEGYQIQKGTSAEEKANLGQKQEDLRILYVALTRARHACWLGVAPVTYGNGKKSKLHESAFGYLLAGGEIINAQKIETSLEKIFGGYYCIQKEPDEEVNLKAQEPKLSEIHPPKICQAEHWWISSYSALRSNNKTPPETAKEEKWGEVSEDSATVFFPSSSGLHLFPKGTVYGTFLHSLLEWAATEGFQKVSISESDRQEQIIIRCARRNLESWVPDLHKWFGELLTMSIPIFSDSIVLGNLEQYQAEVEFLFPVHASKTRVMDQYIRKEIFPEIERSKISEENLNGMLKGFIDLIFQHKDRYYVLDYKSNWLGPDSSSYTQDAMRASILEHRYDLQYTLYIFALHRHLKIRLGDMYQYEKHVGGAIYLFLRGSNSVTKGVFMDRPPYTLIEKLDLLFSGEFTN